MSKEIDLSQIFSAVSGALQDNKASLNKADSYNQNHGDNMVQIFELITKATQEKQGETAGNQLRYAADLVGEATQSGSAQMYVQGLQRAAKEFGDKGITLESVTPLIQMLLNGGEKAPAGGSSGGDLVGSLLGGLSGGGKDDDGLDVGDLVGAGLAFLNAKEEGDSNLEALTDALISGTAMGNSESGHRAQSSQVVANTVLGLLSQLGK